MLYYYNIVMLASLSCEHLFLALCQGFIVLAHEHVFRLFANKFKFNDVSPVCK
jgi:hypothetical protein